MNFPQVFATSLRRTVWSGLLSVLLFAQVTAYAQAPAGTTSPASPSPIAPTSSGSAADTTLPAPGTDPVLTPAPISGASVAAVPPKTTESTPRKSAPARDTYPGWRELTPTQRQALQPLAEAWPSLSELHKRKWMVLSQNFAELSRQEQDKLQERMSDWANLTARARAQARLHFAEVRQLPNDERLAKWEAYQALSDDQRRKLADDILLEPPRGAAVASRPVAARKLTQLPTPKPDQMLQPRIDTDQIHPKTLLPHFLQGTSTR